MTSCLGGPSILRPRKKCPGTSFPSRKRSFKNRVEGYGIDSLGPHTLISFFFLKILLIHYFSVLFVYVWCLCAGWHVPQCPCRGQRTTWDVGLFLLLLDTLVVAHHWFAG